MHKVGSIAYLMQGGYTSNGNGNDTGNGGPFRLWGLSMFGQASWLLIFAFLSVIACIPRFKREKWSIRNGVLAFFLLWLITDFVFFSFSNFFHRYYLCVLAPPIAVLIGMGLPEMVQAFKEKRKWFGWLLPLSLLVTSIMSILFILHYPILRLFLVPIIALFTVISLLFLFLYRRKEKQGYLPPAIACTLAAILTAPFYWCLTVIWFPPVNSTMPYAGPELATQVQTRSMTSNQETMVAPDASTKAMEDYLVKNYQPGSFLVVTSRSDNAAAFIIDTGLPAVAYGGFVGTDKGLTLSEIKNLVNSGKITYFLLAEETGPGEFSNFSISAYVKTNAKLISPSEYGCGNMISSLNGTASFSLYRFNK
ncbi:MAG TPA: hypothetical protein DEP42_02205 [Ruminococcaceae bacterium]|nr:hypothetical protein [Oscillospiraceae bacterium]